MLRLRGDHGGASEEGVVGTAFAWIEKTSQVVMNNRAVSRSGSSADIGNHTLVAESISMVIQFPH